MGVRAEYRIGKKYGTFTVLAIDELYDGTDRHFKCQCDCGRVKSISRARLVKCLSVCECMKKSKRSWGELREEYEDEYTTWRYIRQKDCCDEWKDDFAQFIKDMGRKEDGRRLIRVDKTKGYYIGNCKWVLQPPTIRYISDDSNSFIRSVESSMLKNNITIAELAKRSGINLAALRRILARKGRITLEHSFKLMRALGEEYLIQ